MNSTFREYHILTVSAEDEKALKQRAGAYPDYLSRSDLSMADISYDSNRSAHDHRHRLALVVKSKEKARQKLARYAGLEPGQPPEIAELYTSPLNGRYVEQGALPGSRIAFLFTGQGSLYPRLAEELYRSAPVFKESLDRCDTLFSAFLPESLPRLLYPGEKSAGEKLKQPLYAQALIFSIEYALSRLWLSWGIAPAVVIGHSIGEYAAACIAGLFSLEEAVRLVAARGRIMQDGPGGGEMIGVLMDEAKARRIIAPYAETVSIAAVNTPQNVTLSGDEQDLKQVIRLIKKERCFVEHLDISHPFHSILMTPYVDKFRQAIGDLVFAKPGIPIISTITGRPGYEEMAHADYWCNHIRHTVRFYDALTAAEKQGIDIFVEIGGTAALCGIAADCVTGRGAVFLPSLRKGNRPYRQLCNSLAQLYTRGFEIDWPQFNRTGPSPVEMPAAGRAGSKKTIIKKKENAMKINVQPTPGKAVNIQAELGNIIEMLTGLEPGDIDENASLFTLGLDSLLLIKLRNRINDTYGVDIGLNDILTKYNNLKKISRFLMERNAGQPQPGNDMALNNGDRPPQYQSPPVKAGIPVDSDIAKIMAKQMEIMEFQSRKIAQIIEKQLQHMNRHALTEGHRPVRGEEKVQPPRAASGHEETSFSFLVPTRERSAPSYKKLKLSPDQETFIRDFVARYTKKTKKSKAYAHTHRKELSDWLNALNFRLSLKEIIYPLVSQRAKGSKFTDVDGNEYIDICMGFGVNYFGHNPSFISKAIKKQLEEGSVAGTQSVLAGKVAALICKLAKVERVAFSNTGTETVMGALRLARAVTGRSKIVRFENSFHGTFDGILVEADRVSGGTIPLSPGTTEGMTRDVIVLEYGAPESLERIENLGEDLAAVLVEPVQSRNLSLQPREFLHRLREITRRTGAAFILDDIYMGFRAHQGGSMAYFDIEADIVTFGKIIGGGLPIGVIAGKAEFLDSIDGGYWFFGDDSYPEKFRIIFGGTFCRHPLTMATAYASLKHMETEGPRLQEEVNRKTQHLADSLNRFFVEENVPITMKHFGSLFRFDLIDEYRPQYEFYPLEMDLFYHLLIERGVYVWERRVCCLSAAHSDEDVERIIAAVKDSINEIRQGGFPFSAATDTYSLTPAQQRFFVLNQVENLERAGHLMSAMNIKGSLDLSKLERAVKEIINRHEALRTGFYVEDGEVYRKIYEPGEVDFALTVKKFSGGKVDPDEIIEEFVRPFDLGQPPLMRLGVAEFAPDHFLIIPDIHHIISDGETADIILSELTRLYRGESLPAVEFSYRDYEAKWRSFLESQGYKEQEEIWLKRFSDPLPDLQLPTDFPRPAQKDYTGSLVRRRIDENIAGELMQFAKSCDATLFMIMLAAYSILLHCLSGQEEVRVGIPTSIRDEKDFENLTGYFTNNLVYTGRRKEEQSFDDYLQYLKEEWLALYVHKEYPYETLIERLDLKRDVSRNPLFDVMFIYENVAERALKADDITVTLFYPDLKVSIFDLILEVSKEGHRLDLKWYYSTGLFKKETIKKWAGYFERLLAEIVRDRDILIGDIRKELKIEKKEAQETSAPAELPGENKKESGGKGTERPPGNDIERTIIEIWQQQLNVRAIGVTDNFFELGGRSLDTIRIISGINDRLDSRLSLLAIFEHPTPAELARQVENSGTGREYPAITPAPVKPVYDLSHGQMRYWLNALTASRKGEVTAPGVEITAEAVIIEGPLDYDRFHRALEEVVKRHDILRTVYKEQQGQPVQVIQSSMDVPFEHFDLTKLPPDKREQQLSEQLLTQFKRNFVLKTPPLIRFLVYRVEESRYVLFCNASHIGFDGWSFFIILKEVAYFYNELKASGTVGELPPVMRYVDYVEWQEERIKSGQLEDQANYWTRYLDRKIPVAQIPPDYPDGKPPAQVEPAKVYRFMLQPDTAKKLQETAAAENTTAFVVMFAMLNTWIAILSNQTRITLGTVFSGRTAPELEKIPGIMMNLLPVRADLSGNPDCREIRSRVKQAVSETYANQDYPLDLLAHKLRKTIDLNRDIYSIMFIGQERVERGIHFAGLQMESCPLVEFIYGRDEEEEGFLESPYRIQQDMIVEMFEDDEKIKFIVRYNNLRFKSQTIKQYFDRFKSAAQQFLDPANPRFSQLQPDEASDLDELF